MCALAPAVFWGLAGFAVRGRRAGVFRRAFGLGPVGQWCRSQGLYISLSWNSTMAWVIWSHCSAWLAGLIRRAWLKALIAPCQSCLRYASRPSRSRALSRALIIVSSLSIIQNYSRTRSIRNQSGELSLRDGYKMPMCGEIAALVAGICLYLPCLLKNFHFQYIYPEEVHL